MKTRIIASLLALGSLCTLVHCTVEGAPATATPPSATGDAGVGAPDTQPVEPADASASGAGVAPATLAEVFAKLGPKTKKFTFVAETGFHLQGDGTSFDIPAGAVFNRSGSPFDSDLDDDGKLDSVAVKGAVTIELREFKSSGDMLRGNVPTMTATGEWLESGGAFELKAFAGGKEVEISRLKNVAFTGANVSASGGAAMELWLAKNEGGKDFGWQRPVAAPPEPLAACSDANACKAVKDCFNQASCRPFMCAAGAGQQVCGNDLCLGTDACPIRPGCQVANACKTDATCTDSPDCRVKCKGKCDIAECKGVPICQPVPVQASGVAPAYLFNGSPFGNIGGHNAANCDAITHLAADHVTTFVRFSSNYSAESGVFFIPNGENTAVKLYTKIAGAPSGQEGNKSYDNAMPVGVAGKLVVVAVKGGKYYYEEKAYTIADDNSAGAKTSTVLVNPAELTEAAFNAKVSAL